MSKFGIDTMFKGTRTDTNISSLVRRHCGGEEPGMREPRGLESSRYLWHFDRFSPHSPTPSPRSTEERGRKKHVFIRREIVAKTKEDSGRAIQ